MSMNLNKVLLAGNLTRDPQVRWLANDRAVADFGLAMNQRWKDRQTGDLKEEATFVDVECWGRTAELVGQYLTKGRACYIEGHLKLDQWDDKETGKKRSKLKIVADSVQFLGGKGAGDGSDDAETGKYKASSLPIGGGKGDDEPPFAPHQPWSWG